MIAILSKTEYGAATTKRIGKRTVAVAIELPSGVLTGDPSDSGDGTQVALSYDFTDEDKQCMADMFLSLTWQDTLPPGWVLTPQDTV